MVQDASTHKNNFYESHNENKNDDLNTHKVETK